MPKAKRKTPKKLKSQKKKAVPKKQYRQVIAVILIILGVNSIVLGSVYLSYRKLRLSFQVAPQVTAPLHIRRAVPTHIDIAETKISLPIEEAQITNGVWQTSDHNATHLDTSANPGEGGNIIIYGHNLRSIFGSLKKAAIGDTIALETREGKRHEYVIESITVVDPSAVEVVLPTEYEILTVYTCTEFLDSKRLVIRATPTRVSSL
jgi:LPXTG-site transpeptidase (sortase) family protein